LNKEIDILLAADTNITRPWFRDRIPAINHAIKGVDWECEIVDIYDLLGQHEYMPTNTRDRKSFLQTANIAEANKSFANAVISKEPKILILSTADNFVEFLLPETVRNIRKEGIMVVGTLGDDEFTYPQYRFLLGWFDMFIAYVKPCMNYYESFGLAKGYYLPNSCYLNNRSFSEHSQKTKFDAILVGSPVANRPQMVKALIDAGLNVAIYGSKKWEEYDFATNHYYGFVATEKFDEVLKEGKIILAFLEDHITGNLHMNTKVWEAVRVARLPLTTYYEPLIENYGLQDNVDIVMYKDTKDLVEKVSYLSENENERIKISEALYDRVSTRFDYSILYKNLFNDLMNRYDSGKVRLDASLSVEQELEKNYPEIAYFSSIASHADYEIINHIKVVKTLVANNDKVDYIYFDRLEASQRVILRWPLVNLDSIVFFTERKKSWCDIFRFLKLFFFGRSIHIKQFCVVSENVTPFGWINRRIDRVIHSKLGNYLKRINQRYKAYCIKVRGL
jgi:hypothetical protein